MRAYPWIQVSLRLAMRTFFRRIEVVGLGQIPGDVGGILIAWHPNGLIDPGLIMTQFDRPVVFGARHGLFRYPVLGSLLRAVGSVPIYRAMDVRRSSGQDAETARKEANQRSLEALAERVARGSFSALFPEGDSHDESNLQTLRTGAARLYYRARQLARGAPTPIIVPVGLHYDDKDVFRSNALVAFYPPLELPASLDVTPDDDEDGAVLQARCRALTEHFEVALREVTHATEDWRLHHLIHRARRLLRAEAAARSGVRPGRSTMGERMLGFGRIRRGYYALEADAPQTLAELRRDVAEYDSDLRALGLKDYHLDVDPGFPSKWIAILLALQFVGVFVFLPAIVFFGYLVNLPTAGLVVGASKIASRKRKDEATIKLLLGLVAFPATWVALGVLAGMGTWELHLLFPKVPDTPILGGVSVALLAAGGGIAGLRYFRFARDVARMVRVRATRRQFRLSVARLKKRRAQLHDRLMALAALAADPASAPKPQEISASRTDP
jgi:1-acyl-sn-glycerol-3-phosphate acyltransferase